MQIQTQWRPLFTLNCWRQHRTACEYDTVDHYVNWMPKHFEQWEVDTNFLTALRNFAARTERIAGSVRALRFFLGPKVTAYSMVLPWTLPKP